MNLKDVLDIAAAVITICGFIFGLFTWTELRAQRAAKTLASPNQAYPVRAPKQSYQLDPLKAIWRWGLGIGALTAILETIDETVWSGRTPGVGLGQTIATWIFALLFFFQGPLASIAAYIQIRQVRLSLLAGCIAGFIGYGTSGIFYALQPPPGYDVTFLGAIGYVAFTQVFVTLVGLLAIGFVRLAIYLFGSG